MNLTRKLIILCLLLVVIGCTKRIVIPPGQEITTTDTTTTDSVIHIEKVIPIPVVIKADSSIWEAYFGCDSMNNVYIERIHELATKGVRTEYVFKNNTLYYKTNRDSLQATVWALEKEITKIHNQSIKKDKYVEKPPEIFFQNTKFAKFCIWWFFGSCVALVIYLCIKLRIWRLFGLA